MTEKLFSQKSQDVPLFSKFFKNHRKLDQYWTEILFKKKYKKLLRIPRKFWKKVES